MNSKQKNWLLVGPVIFSFAMAMTVSVIQIHFMQLIDSNILAISEMLKVGIIIVIQMIMPV